MITTALREKVTKVLALRIARHVVPFHLDSPIVSFTFDDFPRSALDVGGRILENEGISGTFYTAFGLADTNTDVGPIGSLHELAACMDRGHEIACHTYDHLDCRRASAREVNESIVRNQAVARNLGLPLFRHFAFPFGYFGIAGKKTAMRHYASARTTMWGLNSDNIDLGLLKGVPIYSRYETLRLEHYLDELQCRRGWLIFYTHDVSARPSPYGCTPEKLRLVVRRAKEIGASILPVGTVVDKLLATQVSNHRP